jgi:RNA polymerase sigma factor (sigma-70 family)
VKLEYDSTVKGVGRFRTTRWTVVMISAQSQTREGRAAFAELYQLYWYPLYAYARRGGHSPENAQDLTQGFFLHLLERRALTHVDRLKGKFRSFLLASFQNYLSVEARRDRRLKRGGDYEFVSLDLESAESRYRLEPVDYLTAETIFDARWAMTLLDRAMTLLRHEYAAHGKASTFETLMVFLGSSDSNSTLSYEEAANVLGVGVGAVRTLIHRLRKQYTCLLREEVARTVSEPIDVQGEIHALCDALIAAEGRLGP